MHFRYRVAAALLGTALLASSAYVVVTSDAFVRRMAAGLLARTVRGPSRVGSATFSFKDGLVVRGLEILDPSDPTGPPAVLVESVRADYGLFLFGDGPRITRVALERPQVRLRRLADGTLSLAHLLQPIRPDEPDEPKAVLPSVSIDDAALTYDDDTILAGGPVHVTGVAVRMVPTGGAWRIEVTGHAAELGELRGLAMIAPEGTVTAHVDLASIPIDAALLRRVLLPGAAEAAALEVRGNVKAHAELAWVPGRSPVVGAKLDIAGVRASVRLPESAPGAPPPTRIDVEVTSGAAELQGDVLALAELELHALGATVRCDGASLSELGSADGPRVRGELSVEGLVLEESIHPSLPHAARRVLEAFGLRGRVTGRVAVRGRIAAPDVDVQADIADGRAKYEGYLREDGTRHGFPWEAVGADGHVSFTGGSLLRFDVDAHHGAAKVHAEGTIDYATGDEIPDITISVTDAPLDADLRAAFQDRAERGFDRWSPSGTAARVDVRVHRDPHADGPFGETTDVTIALDGRAALRPKLLPIDLSDVRGTIQVLSPARGDHRAERVILTQVRARGGGIDLQVDGHVDSDRAVAEDDLVVVAQVADLGGATREAVLRSTEFIPDAVKRLLVDLGASGPVDLRAEIAGDPDRRRDRVTVGLRGVAMTGYRDVPFAAEGLTGTVVVDGDEVRLDGIRGVSLGVPIRADGRLIGLTTGDVEPDLRVEADGLPLGNPLRRALGRLGEKAAQFWDELRPVGEVGTLGTRADAQVVLRPSTDATPVEIRLARIRGPLVPLGLEFDNKDGELHWDGREATVRLDASIGAAEVALHRAHIDFATGVLDVSADTRGLRFPEDVESLLGATTLARIEDAIPGRNVHANGLTLRYDPRDTRLDLAGELSIRPRSRRAGPQPGLAPDGALQVERLTFRFPPGRPVTFEGTTSAAGFKMSPGVEVEDFTGTIRVAGTVDDAGLSLTATTEGAKLVVEGFVLSDASISAGTGVRGPHADASATFQGGRLTAKYGPGAPGVAYRGEIHLRGADLARFGGSRSETKGVLDGDVNFRNVSGAAADLTGEVDLSVRQGSLGKFPVVSAIWSLYPNGGELTDASLQGVLRGPALDIRDLVIRGPVLSLTHGRGSIGFDQTLDVSIDAKEPLSSVVAFPLKVIELVTGSTIGRMHIGGTIRNPTVAWRPYSSGLDEKGVRSREPQPRGEADRPLPPVW